MHFYDQLLYWLKKKEINIDIKIIKFDSNKNKNFLTPDALGCTLFKS